MIIQYKNDSDESRSYKIVKHDNIFNTMNLSSRMKCQLYNAFGLALRSCINKFNQNLKSTLQIDNA